MVKLDSKHSEGIIYEPGDHLSVYPSNNKEMVDELLKLIKCNQDLDVAIYVQKKVEGLLCLLW